MFARLQHEAIDVQGLLDAVRSPRAGALALFLGTVRNHNQGREVEQLEYGAYEAMAERELERLRRTALERFPVIAAALAHRTGTLQIGDVSVAVAVSSAHRADAFEAARWLIDTLKQTVPIWKKEAFEGGEVWIEGDPGAGPG